MHNNFIFGIFYSELNSETLYIAGVFYLGKLTGSCCGFDISRDSRNG